MAIVVTDLVESDLYVHISKEELEGLTDELLEPGQDDPVAKSIVSAFDEICCYVDFYKTKAQYENRLLDCWTKLAVYDIYNRLARVPEKRKEERDDIISFLKDIRNGKFPNMIIDDQSEIALDETGGGCWGSGSKHTFKL